jgi:hypothetical protein
MAISENSNPFSACPAEQYFGQFYKNQVKKSLLCENIVLAKTHTCTTIDFSDASRHNFKPNVQPKNSSA